MFELSIAWKYLLPKRRQLSVSIIGLISILVISLVIWLILVFFSVTRGLEQGWIEKLVTLTAPVRVTPTDKYYQSRYYQIDQYSSGANYSPLSIGEKLHSSLTAYDPEIDEELPAGFPTDDSSKDLVKLLFESVGLIPGVTANDYEVTNVNLRIRLLRGAQEQNDLTQSFLSHPMYLGTFESNNAYFKKILLPFTEKDHHNSTSLIAMDHERKEKPANASIYQEENQFKLPYDSIAGFGILLPKSYRDVGLLLGDRGYISYQAPGASALQEQRLQIFVAGFYDPGIVPLGGKFILASPTLVRSVRSAQGQDGGQLTNGVNVRFDTTSRAENIKGQLIAELEKRGIEPYWKVETYREFDYAKDLLQQLSSEKHIFSLISVVIMIVACSNIISMLIILVNDKRLEIGILRSMGASSTSIALIFGGCGVVMGLAGTLIGTILAFFTLRHLSDLMGIISRLQGYDAFNPMFYGEHLPNSMSLETLITVAFATAVISALAGLIPAVKASRIKPAAILRSE